MNTFRQKPQAREDGYASSRLADLPRIERRPILDFGLLLVSLCVVSAMILATSGAYDAWGPFTSAVLDPWPDIAWLCLAYCLPCIVTAAIVILKDVLLSWGSRYIFGIASVVIVTVVATLCVLSCLEPQSTATLANRERLDALVSVGGIGLVGCAGSFLGLSLPTVHSSEKLHIVPRRFRRQMTLLMLAELVICLAAWLALWLGPVGEPAPYGADWAGWLRDLVAMPGIAFFGAALAVAVSGRFWDMRRPPRQVRPILVALPLVAWFGIALGGALTGVSGLPDGAGWVILIWCVFSALGVLPGALIASLRD